ncbi:MULTISPECIES: MarR family winged helix-turn-helix transcriptional regulator [unclassified Sphingomonas]|jgi:DNA-binding MarR family transcriptional regulator|uniref:MarR family winged helix-turn-helix transcriptional regulator n=1 Tax=unclassified Sphingomonas TaxID=196159 RepID=UPI000929AB64|nr:MULTISPECIES: MarR family winged helix-turn-helix transcriptional regulator [unclassified Sphingomonas]OJU20396.1 MAG: hypothetical protein BGN95_04765 [Sphingomonas sp. 66-10]
MIESNESSKAWLIERLGGLIMRWQDATQRYDETVGEIFRLGPAERLCLSFLAGGPQPASAIARATRLTPAAVTALVDRLEARNYVRRRPDPLDRRKVLVEAGAATEALIQKAYLPLAQAGAAAFDQRSTEELRIVADVLEQIIAIQDGMTEQLLAP